MPNGNGIELKKIAPYIRFVVIIFAMAGAWFSLQARVDSNEVSVDSLKLNQKQISEDVHKVKTDVAVTKNDVEHIKVEQISQRALLDEILREVKANGD